MLDDTTLREVFHFRVSLVGAIGVITVSLIAFILLLSALIIYTPIRNILPGYSASLRQQLVDESARVDSLQADLTLQRQYLDVIRQVMTGDIQMDSVHSLDTLQRVEREKILEQQRSEAIEAFKSQYELKERDRLLPVPDLPGLLRLAEKPEYRIAVLPAQQDSENQLCPGGAAAFPFASFVLTRKA